MWGRGPAQRKNNLKKKGNGITVYVKINCITHGKVFCKRVECSVKMAETACQDPKSIRKIFGQEYKRKSIKILNDDIFLQFYFFNIICLLNYRVQYKLRLRLGAYTMQTRSPPAWQMYCKLCISFKLKIFLHLLPLLPQILTSIPYIFTFSGVTLPIQKAM